MMRLSIVTIFPGLFERVFDYGIVNQARRKELLEIEIIDLRRYAGGRHKSVDDRPFGGGDGMLLKPEPLFEAVEDYRRRATGEVHVTLLSPQGKRFDQKKAIEYSLKSELLLICGRYEGVDQRVADQLADEELSIGDFVLTGGEFAALAVVDATARLLPGAVGKSGSVLDDSFMNDLLAAPRFTRPAVFRGWPVPQVLLSGDHQAVDRWRREQALDRTRKRRPDLLKKIMGSQKETD